MPPPPSGGVPSPPARELAPHVRAALHRAPIQPCRPPVQPCRPPASRAPALHVQRTQNLACQPRRAPLPSRAQVIQAQFTPAKAGKYTFFGEQNSLPENGDIDARTLKVTEPNITTAKLIGVSYLQELKDQEKILAWLRAAAARMAGRSRVYCTQGRERSAFHVFAALYVNDGMSKGTAANLVEQAVLAAQKNSDQTQQMLSRAAWFHGLPDHHPVVSSVTITDSVNLNNNNNNSVTTTSTSSGLRISEAEIDEVVSRNNGTNGWAAWGSNTKIGLK